MLYSMFLLRDNCYVNIFVMREYEDRDGNKRLIIRVEQKDNVVHFCEWTFPDKVCFKAFGFSRLDLAKIKDYLAVNESIILNNWENYHKNL